MHPALDNSGCQNETSPSFVQGVLGWSMLFKIALIFTAILGKSVSATVGEEVCLYCEPTTSGSVNWNFKESSDADEHQIVANGHILDSHIDRFDIADADLIIKTVRQSDSGIYICLEDYGFGSRHGVELTVRGRHICHL